MSSRLAISAFSRSVSRVDRLERLAPVDRRGARRLVEQVGHRRLDRGERAPEVVRDGGEQRPAHALRLAVDLGLRRGPQEPVALEDQRELIAERAEDAALGGRQRRPVALQHDESEHPSADGQREPLGRLLRRPRIPRRRHRSRRRRRPSPAGPGRARPRSARRTAPRPRSRTRASPCRSATSIVSSPGTRVVSSRLSSWIVRSSASRASAVRARSAARASSSEMMTERPRNDEQHHHVLGPGDRPPVVRREEEVVEGEEPEDRRDDAGTEAAGGRGGDHDREVREPLAERRDVVADREERERDERRADDGDDVAGDPKVRARPRRAARGSGSRDRGDRSVPGASRARPSTRGYARGSSIACRWHAGSYDSHMPGPSTLMDPSYAGHMLGAWVSMW